MIWFSDFLPISVIPSYCTVPACRCNLSDLFSLFQGRIFLFLLFLGGNYLIFFFFFSLSFFPLRSAFLHHRLLLNFQLFNFPSSPALSAHSALLLFSFICIAFVILSVNDQDGRLVQIFYFIFYPFGGANFSLFSLFSFSLSIDTTPDTFIVPSCMEDTFVF